DYSPDGDSYSITRGSGTKQYKETMKLDGLGRVISTFNNLSENQTSEYDTFGRLAFKSYPFATGQSEIGDRFEYDMLGRLTTTLHRISRGATPSQCGNSANPECARTTVAYLSDHCRSVTVERALNDSTTTKSCF